jgi:hypothetical protein
MIYTAILNESFGLMMTTIYGYIDIYWLRVKNINIVKIKDNQ